MGRIPVKHMERLVRQLVVGLVALGIWAVAPDGWAQQKFQPNATISSQTGKWKQAIQEKPVKRVDCQVERVSGGDDTYINFRFGDKGKTFPDGKRYYLTKSGRIKLQVPANGVSPGGQPLVINAYNGTVKIVYVTVAFGK